MNAVVYGRHFIRSNTLSDIDIDIDILFAFHKSNSKYNK